VVAHLLATTENFLAVGGGVKRGERPDCGDAEIVADDIPARRAAESGGLAGLSRSWRRRATGWPRTRTR
jgi:hypothetical protein